MPNSAIFENCVTLAVTAAVVMGMYAMGAGVLSLGGILTRGAKWCKSPMFARTVTHLRAASETGWPFVFWNYQSAGALPVRLIP